jgi:hypothetical protein
MVMFWFVIVLIVVARVHYFDPSHRFDRATKPDIPEQISESPEHAARWQQDPTKERGLHINREVG